jgi:nicotinate dehydrogenase medium molybdopterin subunit
MDSGPIASRTTYVTGNAVRLAAAKAKEILFEVGASMLGVQRDQLEAREGTIRVKEFEEKQVSIGEVAWMSQVKLGQPVIGCASFSPPTVPLDPTTGQGKPYGTFVYATQMAEVEVDTETGQVEVLRITASHDCGTPINPMLVEGQVQGGVAMGIGFALTEEILFSEGVQNNPSLANYMLPTAQDVPRIDVMLVDSYDETGPFGAKGVGEPTLVPTAPAIANAVYDAIGIRFHDLPITREKVLDALKNRSKSGPPDKQPSGRRGSSERK